VLFLVLFIVDGSVGTMGSGWRKKSWAAVVARRSRCSKSGYNFFEGNCTSPLGGETNTNDANPAQCEKNPGMKSSKLGCIDGNRSCGLSNKVFRKGCWADLEYEEEPEALYQLSPEPDLEDGPSSIAPKDLDPLVEPGIKNSTDLDPDGDSKCVSGLLVAAAVSCADEPPKQSPLTPNATVFVPIDATTGTSSEVAWLREIVEYQKQSIAHLLGQIHALSQCLERDGAEVLRAVPVACVESGTNTESENLASDTPSEKQQ